MPRRCKVCTDERREAIERDILAGTPAREIAERYVTLSHTSVQRHADNHMAEALAKSREVAELSDAERLKAELERVKADVHRLKTKAEEEGDIKTALMGCDRALKALDLQARVAQLIQTAPTVNVLISPEWLELRAVIVATLEPYSEARKAVLRALDSGAEDSARA
jgi:hypothetical protein